MPTPGPKGDQVRVRVRTCGLNRADALQCRGKYPAPPGSPGNIPGLEYAGEIDFAGPDLSSAQGRRPRLRDRRRRRTSRVCPDARANDGADPPNLDFVEAAAVPEAFITAHDALLLRGQLVPGERVLVHAVGGGVGTAAVQIARAMGCVVLGTSPTAAKLEQTKLLGMDHGIDASRETSPKSSARDRGQRSRGGDRPAGRVGATGQPGGIAHRGRLVLVGLLGGSQGPLDLNLVLFKRITIVGTMLRARPIEEKIAATRRFADQVVPWLERGMVRPVVDSVFPFEDVQAAQLNSSPTGFSAKSS